MDNFFDELAEVAPEETSAEAETVSFTLDEGEDGQVLELIRDDGDGNLFYRDDSDWVEIKKDDELPGFYDREIVEVDGAHLQEAVDLFDKDEEGLSRADIASLLPVKQ